MAHCDFLTGTVSVGVDAPSELLEEPEKLLPDFYRDPNNPRWNSISRILYHESVHFWQIYSSGYIAPADGRARPVWHGNKLVVVEIDRAPPSTACLKTVAGVSGTTRLHLISGPIDFEKSYIN